MSQTPIEVPDSQRCWECTACRWQLLDPQLDLATATCLCGVGAGRWHVGVIRPVVMERVYILIIEDRHCDVTAYPYSTPELALAAAESYLAQPWCVRFGVERSPLTQDMERSGWILIARYAGENRVRVVEVTMDRRKEAGSRA